MTENQPIIYAPRGKFTNDSYRPGMDDRKEFMQAVISEGISTNYALFAPLNSSSFVHLDRTLSIDFYFQDMQRVMTIFKKYYGEGKLFVIKGFEHPALVPYGEGGIHKTGLALDILAESREQAIRIMNAAYMTGIPTIIPNGNYERGDGYIHLDIAPHTPVYYDNGPYVGPWKV